MINLLLSIICSSLIFLLFRYFSSHNINTFTAIVVNYLIASATGFISISETPPVEKIFYAPWLVNAFILGIVFISIFNVMALTSQKFGASVASISNKMALIIPVIFGIVAYHENLNLFKILGIVLALIGVTLSSIKPKLEDKKIELKWIFIPILLFLGSGFIDTFLKYTQVNFIGDNNHDSNLFSATIFLVAFAIGFTALLMNPAKDKWKGRNFIAGTILGVVNFGSIYFLLETLKTPNVESSILFPINNMGVVLFTSLLSFLLFKEKFSIKNKVGILISILAIFLISFSL